MHGHGNYIKKVPRKILGKVGKFERHSSFGVKVITILPEGGFEKPPPPSLNRVKVAEHNFQVPMPNSS